MFNDWMRSDAERLLEMLRDQSLMVATAESCTGGLIAALLTEIPGSSDVVERGFVTYSNEAKISCLGVHADTLAQHGAVSEEVALAMAEGAIAHSNADVAVSVTGIAGPGGNTETKPVGLVHIAVARKGHATQHRECRFGDIGRQNVRIETVKEALSLLTDVLT
ncbi:MAG: CinA family protein [Hyphomicrobiaceae bacterium]